ncbi:TonB-dependent siderophore receptor [Nitrosospira sp. Nsp13]|uniref:TonB-dependent siderophore receptor n=1 Tax=Nitrosospira sp. Nsp13 TaxID=1855332 RepID=UPI00087E00A8|nr:TonB-dependent siderophore receptor [Nitrosospira sp. Nsp13]SCY51629.1 iron complex outermembrane recepter protein [Nitrosospira sp. Nsp13]
MKAYTKTNIGLKHLKHTVISRALQYTFLALSVTGYAHAQQAGTESAKPDTKGKPVAPSVLDAQENNPKPADAGGAAVLPTVVVKDTGHIPGYVTTRTLSATKTDTPIIEVPQSISVINRNEMDMRAVNLNITEALRYVPGVVADQFGFSGQGFEYLGMRGFNVQTTANFRDNLNQAATGVFFGAFITDPYALERIDVLRGPSSVMFGRGDAGGIVNRVTKLPTATPIREFEIQYGNFDRKRVSADFGLANADGTLMFRLVTSALDQDTQVRFPNTNGDRAGIRRFYIAPSLTWRPSDRTSITLFGDILNNRAGAGAFYPAAPVGDPFGSFSNTPTNAVQGDPGFSRYSTNQASFSYKLEHHFNQTWTIRQNFRYQSQSGNFRDLTSIGYLPDDFSGLLLRSALSTTEKINQTVLDTHLQGKLSTGPVNHTVLVGIDWNRMNSTALKFTGDAPSLNVFNPVYFQPVPTPTDLNTDAKQRLDQVGFYIQDQIKYEKWVLTLSGRHDRVSNNTAGVFPFLADLGENPVQNFQNRDSAYTGRAGLTYLFSNGIAPYASYSQSFLPQAGLADGAPFDPTRASQYEVGIKYQPVGTRNLFTVALFELTKTNVLTANPNVSSFANQFIQVGEIRSRGAEVEARAEIFRGMNLIGAFTYNDVKVLDGADGTVGKMPIRVPNTTTSGWLDYNFDALNISWLKGFGIGGGVRYVGRVFNDEENTSTTRSFTLFDAVVRYDHGPWRFFINANNIFNEKYYSASAGGNFFRGTERVVIGTLKLNF